MANRAPNVVPLLTMVLTLFAGPLQAQQQPLTRADVEAMLAERDAVIIELQNTIRLLKESIVEIECRFGASADCSGRPAPDSRTTPGVDDRGIANASDSDPNQLRVDQVAAERALERTLVQSGALLLPRGRVELVPTLTHLVAETDVPVSVDPTSGEVLATEITRRTSALDLLARVGLPGDSQLEVGVPYSSIDERTRISSAGVTLAELDRTARASGDLRLGFAKTLLRESGWRPDIVGRLTYGFGNGERNADSVFVGAGFKYLDATLSFVKRRDPLALSFSLGYSDIREDDGTDPGNAYTVSLGTALATGPDSSLFASVTHRSISKTRVNELDVLGSDVDLMAITLGMSTILRRGQLLNVYTEIGLGDQGPDYSLSVSLPMQW